MSCLELLKQNIGGCISVFDRRWVWDPRRISTFQAYSTVWKYVLVRDSHGAGQRNFQALQNARFALQNLQSELVLPWTFETAL